MRVLQVLKHPEPTLAVHAGGERRGVVRGLQQAEEGGVGREPPLGVLGRLEHPHEGRQRLPLRHRRVPRCLEHLRRVAVHREVEVVRVVPGTGRLDTAVDEALGVLARRLEVDRVLRQPVRVEVVDGVLRLADRVVPLLGLARPDEHAHAGGVPRAPAAARPDLAVLVAAGAHSHGLHDGRRHGVAADRHRDGPVGRAGLGTDGLLALLERGDVARREARRALEGAEVVVAGARVEGGHLLAEADEVAGRSGGRRAGRGGDGCRGRRAGRPGEGRCGEDRRHGRDGQQSAHDSGSPLATARAPAPRS